MLTDSFRQALRNLTKRRLRSWLTIIGIFIGIAAVVALISLGQGLREAVAGQLSGLGADRITIQSRSAGFGPPGLGSSVVLTTGDLRVVQKAQGVAVATGRILQPVAVDHDGAARTFFLASMPEEEEERDIIWSVMDPILLDGRYLRPSDRGKVMVGDGVASEWGGGRADIRAGEKILVAGEQFDVVGVLERRGNPQNDQAVIMNEEDARDLLNITDEYQFLVAEAERPELVPVAREAITKDLRRYRDVDEREEDFTVQTSQELLNTIDSILAMVTGVLAGIAGISLLVGGIGIMNTMYTAVVERTREIGIMKAIGATNNQVLQLFLIEAGMLGLVGGIIGVVLGITLSKLVEFGAAQALGPSVLQAQTSVPLIMGALLFGFTVGTLAGTLPARRAARLPPVEALRQ